MPINIQNPFPSSATANLYSAFYLYNFVFSRHFHFQEITQRNQNIHLHKDMYKVFIAVLLIIASNLNFTLIFLNFITYSSNFSLSTLWMTVLATLTFPLPLHLLHPPFSMFQFLAATFLLLHVKAINILIHLSTSTKSPILCQQCLHY